MPVAGDCHVGLEVLWWEFEISLAGEGRKFGESPPPEMTFLMSPWLVWLVYSFHIKQPN